eukprot:UN32125
MVTKNLLSSTGIGKTMNILRKTKRFAPQIRQNAKSLVIAWKKMVETGARASLVETQCVLKATPKKEETLPEPANEILYKPFEYDSVSGSGTTVASRLINKTSSPVNRSFIPQKTHNKVHLFVPEEGEDEDGYIPPPKKYQVY